MGQYEEMLRYQEVLDTIGLINRLKENDHDNSETIRYYEEKLDLLYPDWRKYTWGASRNENT